MRRYYNKLVRDKIPEIIAKSGRKANTRLLSDEEYATFLNHKLKEEVYEYFDEKKIEELADIQEVINALIKVKGYNIESFNNLVKEKALKNGAFEEKILLESVEE